MSAQTDDPVLTTVAAITDASLERCDLPADAVVMIRLAALAAVDAKPISYLAHLGGWMETGVTLEDVQNVLVAVAPSSAPRAPCRPPSTSPSRSASPSP